MHTTNRLFFTVIPELVRDPPFREHRGHVMCGTANPGPSGVTEGRGVLAASITSV
jgi:hypothetical protein